MGLGGHIMWTAVFRELRKREPERMVIPFTWSPTALSRFLGGRLRRQPIWSPIFDHHPLLLPLERARRDKKLARTALLLDLNDPRFIYHSFSSPERVVFKDEGHAIAIICRHLGLPEPELRGELFFTAEELAVAQEIAARWSPFVVLEPHANEEFTPNKGWFLESWQDVADALRPEVRLVQVGLAGKPVLRGAEDLTGRLTFRQAAALIGRSELLLTTEGGLMHAARAVGTRAVIVYGGYQPLAVTAYPGNVSLYGDAPCAPCGRRAPCPRNKECFRAIGAAQVVEAARRILSSPPSFQEERLG